jgi:transposase
MYLKCRKRVKDGKEHRYWSVVESVRTRRGVSQRQVLYLGEINDPQQVQWGQALEVFDESEQTHRQMSLFPADRPPPQDIANPVQIRLNELQLHRPRQWGACWLALELWSPLKLDEFWDPRLPASRKGTLWLNVLKTLVCYRWINPGSEWQLHRDWFKNSAMADLLEEDASVANINTLYRCLDKVGAHKTELFSFLKQRWVELFQVGYEVLLYDLTSTYFESPPPEEGKRQFGYSRDKRSDCVQVVIALIVTPEGFPVAYEVMPGNTSDKTTLASFLEKIEKQYGKIQRLWLMDRGIPTEETLELMRAQQATYLVGTPRGRLTRMAKDFVAQEWKQVQGEVKVKLTQQGEELYVLACSPGRQHKEQAIRRRKLKKLWARLQEIQAMKNVTRDDLLMKLGAAKKAAGKAWGLIELQVPTAGVPVTAQSFAFQLNRRKLRQVRKGEGAYLLRTNLVATAPEQLWKLYMVLTEIEQAFKELKQDLQIRPIYHQLDHRIEAHIFISFLAYCLQVTLKHKAQWKAPGLTPRAILEKFKTMLMMDVQVPTTDGRLLVMPRYTHPDRDLQLLLAQLGLTLPTQPPPRIQAHLPAGCGADLITKY